MKQCQKSLTTLATNRPKLEQVFPNDAKFLIILIGKNEIAASIPMRSTARSFFVLRDRLQVPVHDKITFHLNHFCNKCLNLECVSMLVL